jgi:hypothetical protein
MKLTILNYHKITGTRSGYAISGVIEQPNTYWFHIAMDDYSGPGVIVKLNRHANTYGGNLVYRFGSGVRFGHCVTADWFSDTDNAWEAIIKEYHLLNP